MSFPILVVLVLIVVALALTPLAISNARRIKAAERKKTVGAGGRGSTAVHVTPAPTLAAEIQQANQQHHAKYSDGAGYRRDAERRPVPVRVIPEAEWRARQQRELFRRTDVG